MSTMQVWLRKADLEAPRPLVRLPAHRVWADVLLLRAGTRVAPEVDIRRTALIGRTIPPPGDIPDWAKVPVDASLCASAPDSDGLQLWQETGWSVLLRERLLDLRNSLGGLDVEEHVLPCTPGNRMRVQAGADAVASTAPPLLQEIEDYFSADISRYLDGWTPLRREGENAAREVVVPPEAL